MSWGDRAERLPPDWPVIRRAVLDRDGWQCTVIRRDGTRCPDHGDEVDHIVRGDDHRMENLRAICTWHHRRKSSAEGNAARRRLTTQRPAEAHPGLL